MDCGQQFRLSGRRRTVGPGVATQETFRQKIVERFDADYLIKAREHSAGRNNATARLLALLSFLLNLGAIPAACQVEEATNTRMPPITSLVRFWSTGAFPGS